MDQGQIRYYETKFSTQLGAQIQCPQFSQANQQDFLTPNLYRVLTSGKGEDAAKTRLLFDLYLKGIRKSCRNEKA